MSSIPSKGYKNIKFGKEKIWIPWRIIDYKNKFVNHTGLLFPIIYYYSGKKDPITSDFNLTTKILDYKLCNETSMETSMEFKRNIHQISIPLNEIFCIDMDELDMGGSWTSEFTKFLMLIILNLIYTIARMGLVMMKIIQNVLIIKI